MAVHTIAAPATMNITERSDHRRTLGSGGISSIVDAMVIRFTAKSFSHKTEKDVYQPAVL